MKVGHKEKGVNRFAGVLALAVLSLLAFIGAAPFASDDLFVVNVRVEKSLMTSLIEAMPDNEKLARLLASACEEVLRFRMDTRSQMAPGDEAALVFKENAKDAPVRLYGVRYKSRLLGRTLRAYYFWEPRREEPEYFDAHGKAFITRLKRSPVTSYKRLGRLYNAKRGQKELEIRAAKHAEVKTPFRARVERINWRPVSEGGSVELKYLGTGIHAVFTRLGTVSVKARPGTELEPGTAFARVGDLGDGRGFGVRYALRSGPGDDAGAVDPFDFHQREDYVLGGTALGMFEVVRRKIDALIDLADQRDNPS